MRRVTEREPKLTPQDIRYSLWVSRETRLPPRQISEEVRLERELELIELGVTQLDTISQAEDHRVPVQNYPQLRKSYEYRKREREAWEEEKRRLGLDKLGR